MALARPVGFFVVLRFQGRFFSPLLEMMDALSELSRLTVSVEVFPLLVISPGLMLGNSGALSPVGDSTMGVMVTAPLASTTVAEKASAGAVAERVVMGAGALSDLFEDCLRTCPEEGASVLLCMGDSGLAASRRLVDDEDGVTARCMLTGLAVVGVTTSSTEVGEGEAGVVAAAVTGGADVEVVRGLGAE